MVGLFAAFRALLELAQNPPRESDENGGDAEYGSGYHEVDYIHRRLVQERAT